MKQKGGTAILIKCPECELQVSDKAQSCPHCGYPMLPEKKTRKQRSSSKRKRLPNGFGQISEIRGKNLRKPFRAMVSVGKRPDGRPICKPLKPESYFSTYNEAYAALIEYNKNPYDLGPQLTVKELYEKWSEEYIKTLKNPASFQNMASAWLYCSELYDMRVCDVRARHIKGCMENGMATIRGETRKLTANGKIRVKSLFNHLLDYAVEYELVDRNHAKAFEVSNDIKDTTLQQRKGHIPYTDEEMKILWDNVDRLAYIDVILIQCYSGWRPQELGLIELENVDLVNWTFMGGLKTKAGINRLVPIHPRIRPLVERRYKEASEIGSKYLINCTEKYNSRSNLKFIYNKYQTRLDILKKQLQINPEHRCHDGRVHFVTQAKKYGVDEYAIKYMVGHAITDVTERVYTKREAEWLAKEIEKIE